MGTNKIIRKENFYIEHEVYCLTCGKFFIPIKQKYLKELNIPPLLANNYCCRTCFDNMEQN